MKVLNSLSNDVVELIIMSVIYFLPALIANALPVIFIGKIIKRRTPLDMGRNFIDGKRVLGPNKTVEGFIVGAVGGLITGLTYYVLLLRNPYIIFYGLVMGLGAMIGDSINSFIKRRLNIPSGDPFVPLDQLSFVLTSYVLVRITGIDGLSIGLIDLHHLSMIVVIVMIAHPVSNFIAYLLKLKDKPW